MSWLGRGIGEFGSQVGQGYDINQQWRFRDQQMKMEAARQALMDLMAPLQLQELQEKIRQMKGPQYEGMYATPGGGTAAAFLEPGATSLRTQELSPGMDEFTGEKVDEQGRLWGLNKRNGKLELIPGQEGAKFRAPGTTQAKGWTPIRGVGGLFAGVKSPDGNEYFSEETIPDPQGKALFRSMKDTEARYLQHQQEMYLLSKSREQGADSNRKLTEFFNANKLLQPIRRIEDVSMRAQGYVDNPTGPGDVALLSAFVEATKPQNGFRWTQQEVNLIRGSRGIIEAASARVQGGYSGILFESEQRRLMGQIIGKAGQLAQQREKEMMAGISKFSPDVAAALQMTPGGELPEEEKPVLPSNEYELEHK
jgi:hypothetical protein